MDLLTKDLLKLIAFRLDWSSLLQLQRVDRRMRNLINNAFWKEKLYLHFKSPQITYDNHFCNLLLNEKIALVRKINFQFTKQERENYAKIPLILARYLRKTHPTSFKSHRFSFPGNIETQKEELLFGLNLSSFEERDIVVVKSVDEWVSRGQTIINFVFRVGFVVNNKLNLYLSDHDEENNLYNLAYKCSSFKNFVDDHGLGARGAHFLYFGTAPSEDPW